MYAATYLKTAWYLHVQLVTIKTHGSESRGQEEAASMHPLRPRGHYSE